MESDGKVYDLMNKLSDAEMAYIARWAALTHPDIAEKGLEALAAFKRDYPDQARLIFPPRRTGSDQENTRR